MIISSIEGRIRLRSDRLKCISLWKELQEELNAEKGIESIDLNPKTGSILILFDSSIVTNHQMESKLIRLFQYGTVSPSSQKTKRSSVYTTFVSKGKKGKKGMTKGFNALMLGSLVASMLGIAVDNEELHVLAGISFLGLASKHIYQFRKRILK